MITLTLEPEPGDDGLDNALHWIRDLCGLPTAALRDGAVVARL
jgi:hypothetical protein